LIRSDPQQLSHSQVQVAQEELQNLMTIIYISIQACVNKPLEMAKARKTLGEFFSTSGSGRRVRMAYNA